MMLKQLIIWFRVIKPGSLAVRNRWKRKVISKILDTYSLDRMMEPVEIYNKQYCVINIKYPALNNCNYPSILNTPSVRSQKLKNSRSQQFASIAFGTTVNPDRGKESCIVELEPCKCGLELPCQVHPQGIDTIPEELFKPDALADMNREGHMIEFKKLIRSREPVILHVKREEMTLSTLIQNLESGKIRDRRKIKFPLKDPKGNRIDFDKTVF